MGAWDAAAAAAGGGGGEGGGGEGGGCHGTGGVGGGAFGGSSGGEGGSGGDEGGGIEGGACRTTASTCLCHVKSMSESTPIANGRCARHSTYEPLSSPSMPPGSCTSVESVLSSSPP